MKWLVFSFRIFFFASVTFHIACEQQTHFRSSLLSLRKIAILIIGGREETNENASAVRGLHFIASGRLNMSHLKYYFLFTVENVIKWSLVPWRSPFRHILAPSERFFPFLVKDSCRGFIEKGTHFLWISPTVKHSNKTGNCYSTSLFVNNDLT